MLTFRRYALFLVQTSLDNPASYRGEARDLVGGAYEKRACPRSRRTFLPGRAICTPFDGGLVELFLPLQLFVRNFVCDGILRITDIHPLDFSFERLRIRMQIPSEVPRKQRSFRDRDIIALFRTISMRMKDTSIIDISLVKARLQHFPSPDLIFAPVNLGIWKDLPDRARHGRVVIGIELQGHLPV